jgi:glycosyltransferase involved in cell wall biosynthesis
MEATLTILGMQHPSGIALPSWVKMIPTLRKGMPEEFRKLSELYQTADVLLLPARADFTPNVIAEACAFGLPTISSGVGGIPEMIDHGESGWVLSPNSPAEEYAHCIVNLGRTAGLRKQLAINCRQRYEQSFALSVVAHRIVHNLQAAIAQTCRQTVRCEIDFPVTGDLEAD